MADSTTHVIQYIGDLNDIFTKVKELTRINQLAAKQMGQDFANAVKLIDQQISKISQKPINVPVRNAQGQKTGETTPQLTDTRQITSIIETADGKLQKFVETQVKVDGAFKSTNLSISAFKEATKQATAQEQVFVGTTQQVVTQLGQLERINQQIASNFGKAGEGAQVLGTSLSGIKTKTFIQDSKQVTQETRNFDTAIKLANGSTKTLRDTITSVGGNVTNVSSSFVTGAATAKTFGENLKFILQRAALTIPVWFALRQSLQFVFSTIKEGLSSLIEFDLALQKIRRNLTGTPAEIQQNFKQAKREITDFSIATGKSTEEISEAVKAFATVGFSFQDALKGGIEATKLSILLFGDAGETARTFARSIRILGDESEKTASIQEQMAETFALTAELEKKNQFELSEVNESLIKFAPTAKSAGLSLQQTLVLLATLGTAGRTGSNAGTLLSSSVNELRGNLDKLAGSLQVGVNPQFDNTFTLIGKVLEKSEQLAKSDKLGASQATALAEVFGGQRGTKPIESLTALNKAFKENSKVVADTTRFNKEFKEQLDTLPRSVAIFNNTLRENGKLFVNALVGGEDFNASIKNINKSLVDTRPTLEGFGTLLNTVFTQLPAIVGIALLPKLLVNGFRVGLVAAGAAALTAVRAFLVRIGAGFIGGVPGLIAAVGFTLQDSIIKGINNGTKKAEAANADITNRINQALFGKATNLDLKQLIVDIQTDKVKLGPGLNKESILKNLQAQLDRAETKALVVKVEAQTKFNDANFFSRGELEKINEIVKKNSLEIAKNQGASTSELLKQEGLLNKQFHIYEDEFSILDRQLAIQRALSEEKRLQNKLGSDSIKLFDIAQENGVEAARAIGDVLSGDTDFSTFVRRGGEAVEIFKKEFADVFKQQQAQAFFNGDTVPGAPGLRGGANVAIQETFGQNGGVTTFNPQAANLQARLTRENGTIPTIRNEIAADIKLTLNLQNLSFREAKEAIKAEIAKEILNPNSPTGKAIDQRVTGETNTNL